MYRMLRDSGMSIIGAALMAFYVFVIAGPFLMFVDWYGKNNAGENGDFLDDPDFFGPYGEVKTIPHDPNIPYNESLMCPPIGSKEWEDWVDNLPRLED